jgi:hypothetical protein
MVLKEKYQTKLKIDDQIWTSKNKILHQIKNKNCLKPGSYYNNAHHEFSIKEYDLCKAITPMLIMSSATKNMIYVRLNNKEYYMSYLSESCNGNFCIAMKNNSSPNPKTW